MRLILVDAVSDLILADSLEFTKRCPEWNERALNGASTEDLAMLAARLFDEGEGRHGWSYTFHFFWPEQKLDGYDVFRLPELYNPADGCAPDHAAFGKSRPNAPGSGRIGAPFSGFVDHSQYEGYVKCIPPGSDRSAPA
ncbi:hypothetical protein ACNHKD_06435 [Methylocystis sp. JAN1]|uniref:hypothetical protein n=1 Tax=Methylocystis sp. JAN1 TaxID=3397211 RepID=UPI003FA2F774